jgi:hypothetical protein
MRAVSAVPSANPEGVAVAWYICAVLLGWILATAVVAALTASLFRE